MEKFQRVSSAGEFRLRGFPPASANKSVQSAVEVDEMPPSRITDLHVTSFDLDNFTVNLEWTAVGEDMERGTASKYTIFISDDFNQLILVDQDPAPSPSTSPLPSPKEVKVAAPEPFTLLQQHVIKGKLDAPLAAGQTEYFDLWLEPTLVSVTEALLENRTVFLSVRAVDSVGNAGAMSNVVSLSRAAEVAVPRVPISSGSLSLETYLAVVLPSALVLLAFLVISVGLVVYRARKIRSEKIDQMEDWLSVNMGHMNYMFEGEYRKRSPEDLDNWSKGSI